MTTRLGRERVNPGGGVNDIFFDSQLLQNKCSILLKANGFDCVLVNWVYDVKQAQPTDGIALQCGAGIFLNLDRSSRKKPKYPGLWTRVHGGFGFYLHSTKLPGFREVVKPSTEGRGRSHGVNFFTTRGFPLLSFVNVSEDWKLKQIHYDSMLLLEKFQVTTFVHLHQSAILILNRWSIDWWRWNSSILIRRNNWVFYSKSYLWLCFWRKRKGSHWDNRFHWYKSN